jgi:hypothetical protein
VTLGDFEDQSIILDRIDRALPDDLLYTRGGGCTRADVIDVVAQLRVRRMAMRIDQL